ncbi:MAG: hypothetical protein EPN50_04735 [Chloroflexota bacterium]|nr:MAG: hypothetical protein EPN50_04735 [Chloroflexota bacterium]
MELTRDERLMAALRPGPADWGHLAQSCGLPERTARAGLVRLQRAGLVFSPARGRYRLTAAGQTIAGELPAGRELRI